MIVRMVNHPDHGLSLDANGEPGDRYPDLSVLIPESEMPVLRQAWDAGQAKEIAAHFRDREQASLERPWEAILEMGKDEYLRRAKERGKL